MSDCKHFWIMPDAPECVDIVCRACRKPLLAVEANAIINRAERAEERVKELEDIVHGIGNLLEENGHTVTFTLKANRLITKCHELFRTENK